MYSTLKRLPLMGCAMLFGCLCSLLSPAQADENEISYSRDIKPIFADNCFGCHQPARDRGSYVMTDFELLLGVGDSGEQAIVPGKPDESYLMELITPDDEGDAQMPQKAKPLSAQQIELITRWIEQGAKNDQVESEVKFTLENPPTYSRRPIISSIDFSPDGKQLAVTGFHEVLLLDVSHVDPFPCAGDEAAVEQQTGKVLHRLIGISPRVTSVKFSPDGSRIAVAGGSPGEMGEIQIWDATDGRLQLSKSVSYDTVFGVSWSPDGSKVAFGCTDNTVRAIDSITGEQVLFQGAHDDWIRDTVFSNDGSQLVSVGRDMSCKLIEVPTQRFVDNITSITPGVLKGGINSVVRHPTRNEVVIGGSDGIPKVYRMNRLTKRVIGDDANLIRRMPAMPGRINSVAVSNDAKRIAAGSSLDGIGHVHVYSYEFDASLPDDVKARMSKAVGGRNADDKRIIEEYVTRNVRRVSTLNIDAGSIYSVVFHPKNIIVAAGGSDGIIRLLNGDTGKIISEITPVELETSEVVNDGQLQYHEKIEIPATADSAISGKVNSLSVWPESIELNSPTAYSQIVVQANLNNGSTPDVTHAVSLSGDTKIVKVDGSFVQALANGQTEIEVEFAGVKKLIPVKVQLPENWQPDFVQDVNPILTKVGCNAGTCHGSQGGKKGFKLSLRGYDPLYDIRSFTDDISSRRTNVAAPDNSLMLMKPTGQVAHEGGVLIERDSKYYHVIRNWIASGAALNLTSARVVSVEMFPKNPVLPDPNASQQMRVVATYSDGTKRDVTREAVIETGDMEIATVEGSKVTALRRGEAPILARFEGAFTATTLTCMGNRDGFEWAQPVSWTDIDQMVADKWQRMKIRPSDLCTDEEFIRRIYLDLTGLPPTPEAMKAFVADERETQTKRNELVDQLIGNDDFIDHWSNKWADLLQVNRKYLGVEGAKSFRTWIRNEVATNTPYDQFVTKILTAEGSNRENPAASYFKIHRNPVDTMENTTHLFLATRFNCNKCHDHPFERWTQDQYYETAAYFAQVNLKRDPESGDRKIGGTAVEGAKPLYEFVSDMPKGEVTHDRTGQVTAPAFPFDCDHETSAKATRRQQLAAWITSPDNQYFATSYVNRLWGYMMGVGLIEPLDDIRAGNPPTNPQLLEYLRSQFIESGFNSRHMLKLICKSRVYQLSIKTNRYNEDDRLNYSHALARRLPAEVLFDTIHRVTGSKLKIPGVPEGTRASALPDVGVKLPSGFLSTLGRPVRESACECERSTDLQLGSVLALVSGPDVARAVSDPTNAISSLVATEADDRKLVNEIFARILNRAASEQEIDLSLESFAEIAGDHQKLVQLRDQRQKVVNDQRPELEKTRESAMATAKAELDQLIKSIDPELLKKEKAQRDAHAATQKELKDYEAQAAGFNEWVQSQTSEMLWHPLQVSQFKSEAGKAHTIRDDRAILVERKRGPDHYSVVGNTQLTGITGFRLEMLPDAALAMSGPGLADNGNLVLNEIYVDIAHPDRPDEWEPVVIKSAIANFEQAGFPIANTFNGNVQNNDGWALYGATGKVSWATYQFKLPTGYRNGSRIRFRMHQKFDDQHQVGCFRISLTNFDKPLGLGLSEQLTTKLSQPFEKLGDEFKKPIQESFAKSDVRLTMLRQKVAAAAAPVPVDAKIVAAREKLARVSMPVPADVLLTQYNADIQQSEMQLKNKRLTAAQDLAWALINSPSFLFNR